MRLRTLLLGTLILGAGTVAHAGLITFDSLAGPNGTPFTGTTEDGFNVTPSAGSSWQQGFNVGNPIPSIFNFTAAGEGIVVSQTMGSLFTFNSIDLGTGGSGSYDYTLTGSIGAAVQFVQAGTFSGSVFLTVASAFASTTIDSLDLTISNFNITSVNVDNIAVTAVPEPATMSLLGLGLIAGFLRRRRNAA